MRTSVEIKWFKTCETIEQVATLYKALSKQHHPDMGGDLRTMQEINVEYDEIKKNPWRLGSDHGDRDRGWSGFSNRTRNGGAYRKSRARTWDDFRSSTSMKPGRYTCEVTSIKENAAKKYVALVFDVAEGPHEGHFGFEPWFKHCIYLKYETDWQLKNTRRIVGMFNRSNPGFDGDYAFCNDRTWDFVGKKIGIELSQGYIDGHGFINADMVYEI